MSVGRSVDVSGDGSLTVRMVTARMVPAIMMNTAPLKSSINVSLRLRVVSTPHRSYCLLAKRNNLSVSFSGSLTGSGIDSK